MPQSLSQIQLQLICSTKDCEPLITLNLRPRLHACIVGILDILTSPSLQTGGVDDHVHILFRRSLQRCNVGFDERYIWD
jgi:putative transposase